MSNAAQDLIQKIQSLPPEYVEEVGDFVDFLRSRANERVLNKAATKLSEAAFQSVWDNPNDAAYDEL